MIPLTPFLALPSAVGILCLLGDGHQVFGDGDSNEVVGGGEGGQAKGTRAGPGRVGTTRWGWP